MFTTLFNAEDMFKPIKLASADTENSISQYSKFKPFISKMKLPTSANESV